MNKTLVVVSVLTILILGGLLWYTNTLLQALASVMTLILHPWFFLPILIPAILLVLVYNAIRKPPPPQE